MKNLLLSGKIYVDQSKIPSAGRGVFARVAIKKGDTIERCPVIEIPKHELSRIQGSMLVTYIYFFGKQKDRLILVLGFGSIYNHSYQQNAVYKEHYKENEMSFIATKDIKKHEEITVNYNLGDKKNTRPLWFEAASLPK